jgi:hypothetical protein
VGGNDHHLLAAAGGRVADLDGRQPRREGVDRNRVLQGQAAQERHRDAAPIGLAGELAVGQRGRELLLEGGQQLRLADLLSASTSGC